MQGHCLPYPTCIPCCALPNEDRRNVSETGSVWVFFNPNDTIIISTQGVPVTNHAGNMKADSKEQIWNHHSGSGASGSTTLIDARLGKLYLQLSRQRQCFCFVTSAWQFHSPTRWQAGQPESILPFPKNILRIFTGLFRINNSTEIHQKAC